MQILSEKEQAIIAKIRQLPLAKVLEVEDFIDFLGQQRDDRQLVWAASQLSESALTQVWDNDEDAAYDNL
jgi:hypothetical protein